MRLRFDASLPAGWPRLAATTRCVFACCILACCASTSSGLISAFAPAPVRAQQFDYDPDGYWKMPQAAGTKGEFNGEDPIGLASRQHIPTDCAIHWQDEGGKTYCFSSAMSSQIFQDERMSILPKAVAFWTKERSQKLGAPGESKNTKPDAAPPAGPQPH